MNQFPHTWTLRHGPDAGKVLIAFSTRGPLWLVGPDGAIERQFRLPPTEAQRNLSTTNEEVA